MKEILASVQRGFFDTFMSLPEDVRFRITALAAYAALFGPGYGGKTPRAKRTIYNYIDGLRTEKPVRLSEYIDVVDGFDKVVSGKENLPDGPFVVAINHPSVGVGRGLWMMFYLNHTIARYRQDLGLDAEPRWIQHDGAVDFKFDGGIIEYHRRKISDRISRFSGTFLVGKSGDPRNDEAKERALAELRDGGIVVVCPEGKTSNRLSSPSKGAGRLLELLGGEAPIVPAAAWISGKDVLRLDFAEPISLTSTTGEERNKLLINKVMGEIANLLPPDKK